MRTLTIQVSCKDDDDGRLTYESALQLRELTRQLPGAMPAPPAPSSAPEGSKGVGLDVATLALGVTGGLPGILAMIQQWRGRQLHEITIEVEMDGDRIAIPTLPDEAKQVLEAWLRRQDSEEHG